MSAFKRRREQATSTGGEMASDEELFDELEHELGIDRDAAVCSSAIAAQYASKCCS